MLKKGQIREIKIGNILIPGTLAIPVQRHLRFVTVAEDHGRFRRSPDLTPVSNQPWLHVAAPAVAVIFP